VTVTQFLKANLEGLNFRDRCFLKLASWVAIAFHYGQRRRSGDHYYYHCLRVGNRLKGEGINCQIAGLLHDILEQLSWLTKPLAMLAIILLFGWRIFRIVCALTDWWDNDERYYYQMARAIAAGYHEVLIVKLADKIDVVSEPFHQSAKRTIGYLRSVQGNFTIFALSSAENLSEGQRKAVGTMLTTLLNVTGEELDRLFPYDDDNPGVPQARTPFLCSCAS